MVPTCGAESPKACIRKGDMERVRAKMPTRLFGLGAGERGNCFKAIY